MAAGPDVWGPHGWKFLHFVTLGYPYNPSNNIKETYYNFFNHFAKVIPCSICANHFQQNLKKHPLDETVLSSKENLINWGIDIHNEVNLSHGKKIYSYEEGLKNILDGSKPINCSGNMDEFTNLLDGFSDNKYYIITIIILIIIIIIMGFQLSKK
jgi:hypothetical protein